MHCVPYEQKQAMTQTLNAPLNRSVLRGLLHLAGKNEPRQYLNAVAVYLRPKAVVCVATDGNVLGAYRMASDHTMPDQCIFIPRETLKHLRKSALMAEVSLVQEGDGWALVDGEAKFGFIPVTGSEYNFAKVLPGRFSGENAQFDVALVEQFADCAKELGAKSNGVAIWHNGEGPAGVTLHAHPDFFGLIMPLRLDRRQERVSTSPGWLYLGGKPVPAANVEDTEEAVAA